MKGYFFPTDQRWFEFLRAKQAAAPERRLDEVNFWRPTATTFKALRPGEPFFFKLKSPHDSIGGFGYFARYSPARVSEAWKAFGELNGAADFETWRRDLLRARRQSGAPHDFEIGCIMISAPVFFPRELWIDEPAGFPSNSPAGRGYGLDVGQPAEVLRRCLEAAALLGVADQFPPGPGLIADGHEKHGAPIAVRPRLGQGTFRVGLIDAYGRACAVTNEHSVPVLEAAHIRPYAGEGTHSLDNGLLLRMDVHRLFDLGYVTIDPDHRFVVSSRLRQDYGNGRAYDTYHGKTIRVPAVPIERPSREALEWHNTQRFRG